MKFGRGWIHAKRWETEARSITGSHQSFNYWGKRKGKKTVGTGDPASEEVKIRRNPKRRYSLPDAEGSMSGWEEEPTR